MRSAMHEVHLVDDLEIGPDTLVAMQLAGRQVALIERNLDRYLKRTDSDPRQWIDPERMSAEVAYLMVRHTLEGARSSGACTLLMPVRCLPVLNLVMKDPARHKGAGDIEAVAEQTHDRIVAAISIARH